MEEHPLPFAVAFEQLSSNLPLSWQCRLHDQWLAGDVKPVIDLPTGLGKTMAMAIWFLARAEGAALPTRLVYVVDRRTVVDQATDKAKDVLKYDRQHTHLGLTISTLRGQFADNREWTNDPSRPAIIIGTVDMIGSRLLFSGYNVSPGLRPIHAGLLGQDSLVVLDEAHLSPAFDHLLCQIEKAQAGNCPALQRPVIREPRPMRVVRMSATSSAHDTARFTLEPSDLQGNRETNLVLRRFEAEKRLFLETNVSDPNDAMAAAAIDLAKDNSRVVVFVRRPADVGKIKTLICKKDKSCDGHVEILTGTMRGLERDNLLDNNLTMKRFLDGDEKSADRTEKGKAILIATSAGEVGFDLNADHLVCDAAPLDSMIQRLGRVNRRGDGVGERAAQVRVFVDKRFQSLDAREASRVDLVTRHAMQLLADLSDASPKALAELKKSLTKEQIGAASSPEPQKLDLTDILLDAWSMTSIRQAMPGRPMVEPWLRGIDENETPQTTLAWRVELNRIEDWDALLGTFDDFPLKPHELLRERTDVIIKALAAVPEELQSHKALLVGAESKLHTLGSLAERALRGKESLTRELRDKTLMLPASVGGIDEKGLFTGDWEVVELPTAHTDVADISGDSPQRRERVWCALESPDPQGPLRPEIIESSEEIPRLRSEGGMRYISSVSLSVNNEGEPIEWFAYYAAEVEGNRNWARQKQSLKDHVSDVVKHANESVARLSLDPDLPDAFHMAASEHDVGKGRELWQTYAGWATGDPVLGKSNRYLDWRMLGGFRHEFGSLCDAMIRPEIAGHRYHDLILHLIAAHHGHARPHFEAQVDRDSPVDCAEAAAEVPVRFARLQRTYGRWGLAWFESILRCADQRASAEAGKSPPEGLP